MAWNEPGGGNNKPKDPWGGGDQGPPDLDEALKKLQDKLGGLFGGGGSRKSGGSPGSGGISGALLAVIEHAGLVVANDSAALHIAVGFDKPIVALFGPTDTALVGPYRRNDAVLQRLTPGDRLDHKNDRLGAELMSRITLADALDAAERALAPSRHMEHAP